MSKKLLPALLVLFMVLNLIAGFPVMAEETAGETTETISEDRPDTAEIPENDAGPVMEAATDPADGPDETFAAADQEAGEQGETAAGPADQPAVPEDDEDNRFPLKMPQNQHPKR